MKADLPLHLRTEQLPRIEEEARCTGLLALLVTVLFCCACDLSLAAPKTSKRLPDVEWRLYGGNANGERYSELTDINRTNIDQVVKVWRFDAGKGDLQTSPLMIEGVLYVVTARKEVVALDAASGESIWTFKSGYTDWQPIRGLTFWASGSDRRILLGIGSDLIALDARRGTLISDFGQQGKIDLRQGLDRDPGNLVVFMNSPGVIYRDLIITGFRTTERHRGRRERYAPMTFVPAACAGRFILSRDQETWGTTRGPQMHGERPAARIAGLAWWWMSVVAWFSCRQARR